MMDYGRPALADALAAQYVAGTLRGRARKRFESLLSGHPALRGAVSEWQDRLMPLTQAIDPVAPSPGVWTGIQGRLWPVDEAAAPATEPWWRRLALWRGVSALATVAAIGFAVLLANPPPAAPPIVVVLEATGNTAASVGSIVASISGDGRSVVTRPLLKVGAQQGRALELWAAAGKEPPRSLGLISAEGATVVRRATLPPGTDHMAVSLEPPGGSPTGAPTGPVLFFGKLLPI